jgi:hypothetical protein
MSVWRWVLLLASVTAGLVAYVVKPGVRLLIPEQPEAPTRGAPARGAPANDATSIGSAAKGATKAELLERAKGLKIRGRSKMTKQELVRAIGSASDGPSRAHSSRVR